MSPRHPSKRAQARQMVADSVDLAYWWEAERAAARFYEKAARRERAMERLLHTAAWCCVALTATLCLLALYDLAGL